jgi:nitroreductase
MKSKILILALAVALAVVSAQLYLAKGDSAKSDNSGDVSEAVYNNILSRTSIREYKNNQPVEKEKVEKMLRAGMAAPTALDSRPWHFIVVDDKNVLKQLADEQATNKSAATAALAIAVCGDMDLALEGDNQEYWIQDCSAASENILLEAHALGLGAVWTSTYPSPDRQKKVKEILKMPEEIVPLNIIVIGYPAVSPKPKDKWDETAISYNEYGGISEE